jgi:hypothetical protein
VSGPKNDPGKAPGPVPDDIATREQQAAQLRRDHPRWVVIWAERKNEYQARPLTGGQGRIAVGTTPGELTAEIEKIGQAARPRRKDTP